MSDLISRQVAQHKINALIDEFETIMKDIRERHVDDSVCGLCEYDGSFISDSGNWCNECPGFERDDCFKLKDQYREEWAGAIKNLPSAQPENGTLIIPLNESDFKSVKRIMLDNKPFCRMFYEDVPGEAHWIKKYTPDDGEIYECDNCGVTWQFNDGGPEENEAFFCPKCGFKMMPKEEEEADGQE